jgi:hypothetical protein
MVLYGFLNIVLSVLYVIYEFFVLLIIFWEPMKLYLRKVGSQLLFFLYFSVQSSLPGFIEACQTNWKIGMTPALYVTFWTLQKCIKPGLLLHYYIMEMQKGTEIWLCFRINKKIPRGPPSPPAPVMHSPTRKVSWINSFTCKTWSLISCLFRFSAHCELFQVTVKEQKEWKIPPCISNWKNAKVYI